MHRRDDSDWTIDSTRPLLEEGQLEDVPSRPSDRRKGVIVFTVAFCLGIGFAALARHLWAGSLVGEYHSLAANEPTRAANDYNDRERWRNLHLDLDPKRKVIPHPSLRLKGHKITPVQPADVCVLAIDSRPFNASISDKGDVSGFASAVYSQMSWALRHGYQYRRLKGRFVWKTERWPTWSKVPPLIDTVKECKWTVFTDSDVFFNEPSWSLDDMRTSFGIHDGASIYATNDPSRTYNQHTTNTGFFIIQQTTKAITALEKLQSCAEEIEGCDKYRSIWSHEQAAFEKFIVHKYLVEGEDFIRGDCEMTNGYHAYGWSPRISCNGRIMAHLWAWRPELLSAIRRLVGLDFMRSLLDVFHEEPELRRPFTEVPASSVIKNSKATYISEILQKSEVAEELYNNSDASFPRPPRQQSTCIVAVDERTAEEEIHRTPEGWAYALDGTTTTGLLQLAYALRHFYTYRRIMMPPFPEHNLHAFWHSMKPLSQAVKACEWTMYLSQPVYPVALHVNIDRLLESWRVPPEADMIFFGERSNHSNADMTFALIRRTPKSIRGMQLLLDCQTRDECLSLAEGIDPHDAHDHLKDSFNKVIRPQLASSSVFVVPPCSGTSESGCNSQIYTPENPLWFHLYADWSVQTSKRAAELLGTEVLRYLSTVWSSFPSREQPFAVRQVTGT